LVFSTQAWNKSGGAKRGTPAATPIQSPGWRIKLTRCLEPAMGLRVNRSLNLQLLRIEALLLGSVAVGF
jgi:hypothetical protein